MSFWVRGGFHALCHILYCPIKSNRPSASILWSVTRVSNLTQHAVGSLSQRGYGTRRRLGISTWDGSPVHILTVRTPAWLLLLHARIQHIVWAQNQHLGRLSAGRCPGYKYQHKLQSLHWFQNVYYKKIFRSQRDITKFIGWPTSAAF